ncbi:hypothetical protein [Methylobacterium brachiatum]|uniref:hypothetical protein n=1 Tax=Methylobacterium brachiatum TaxID=269660 RepID=UPI0024487D2D|nr:hypothetical protein [Methylobacterium brachiatum]MDH2313376.1 hypothetical protein [Methylobacterium brachiatum]
MNAFREAHRHVLPGQTPDVLEPVRFPDGAALAESVASFLRAFDRGHLGSFARCGDQDSAWIADMREQLAAYRADRALVSSMQDGGRS